MAQYYVIANLDKREYLRPRVFGESEQLLEFGSVGSGMLCALAVLLADGNGRGRGDLPSNAKCVGSWYGDRIAVPGDYADEQPATGETLYAYILENHEWRDVSQEVIRAMCADDALRELLRARMQWTLDLEGRTYEVETLLALGAEVPAVRLKEWQIARGLPPDELVGPNVLAEAKLVDQRPAAPVNAPEGGLVWNRNAKPQPTDDPKIAYSADEKPAAQLPDPTDTSMFKVSD